MTPCNEHPHHPHQKNCWQTIRKGAHILSALYGYLMSSTHPCGAHHKHDTTLPTTLPEFDTFKYQFCGKEAMAIRLSKKGDLSINIIIVAALGLAVLVILFAVFTGRIGIFGKGVDQTQQQLTTCPQQCQVSGYASGERQVGPSCSNPTTQLRIYGSFSDITAQNPGICCCTRA